MKLILILSLLTISLAEVWIIDEFPDEIDQSLNGYWLEFKSKHNKSYDSAEEEVYRRLVWESNLAFINDHNSMKWRDFSLRMNKFGDISHEEFKEMMNGLKFDKELEIIDDLEEERLALDLPSEIDWRKEGYVTEVKDQGQCGSCWAFSAVAALEGQHFKKSGKLISLSEQNLVDCSSSYGNEGCNGGLMDQAFEYVKDNKGIDTENSYPYTAHDGECKYNPKNCGATDEGYKDIGPVGSEQALMQAIVQIGPVSIAIDASHRSFQFYSDGVYNEPGCSSTDLDHGVAAVGYGTDQKSGRDYYIVKNSWGTGWGIDGYVLMARNAKNMCGVATAASYPLV